MRHIHLPYFTAEPDTNGLRPYFYRTRVRSLFTLVTDSLTHSCLVNLIDVTLMCEDANSKLVEVVTVADAEDHAGNSFLIGFLIGELTFGHKAKLLFRL